MKWYPAPAKLNLFLHILGRREDGYHQLQTVYRLIDRFDRVGIALRTDGRLRRVTEIAGIPEKDDLCLRAASSLKECALKRLGASAGSFGADIALQKVLPIGGGLGGGSSDAATTLIVLNRLWRLNLSPEDLARLALSLGADVPYFLFGRPGVGEGIGEHLRELTLGPAWYLVLTPQVSVSTKEIFSDPALTRDTKPLTIPPFFPASARNDLEAVVIRRYGEVARHLAWLREHVPGARMTGAGACVFAEFSEMRQAENLAARLPAGMRGFVARGLDRHPLDASEVRQD